MTNYIDLDIERLYEGIDEGGWWDYIRGKIDQWTGWGQDSLWTKGKRRNYFGLNGKGGIGYDGVAFRAWGVLYQYFYNENVERCTPQVINALRITGIALNGVAIEQHKVDLSQLDNSNMALSGDPGYADDRVADARRDFGVEAGVNGAFWAGGKAMNSKAGKKVRQKTRNAAAKGYGMAKKKLMKNKTVNNAAKYAKQASQTASRVGSKVGQSALGRAGGAAFSILGVVFEVAIAHDLINAGINWIKAEANKGNPIPLLNEAILDLRNFFRSYGGYMNMGYPVANGLDTHSVETAINTLEYAVNNSILSYEEWCDMMKRKYPNTVPYIKLTMADYYRYYNIPIPGTQAKQATPAKKNSSKQTRNNKSNIQENMRYNSKKNQRTFLLTENDIRKIVSESTMAVLNEGGPWKWLVNKLAKREASAAAKRAAKQMAEKQAAEAAAKKGASQAASKTAPQKMGTSVSEMMRLGATGRQLQKSMLSKGFLRPEEIDEFIRLFGNKSYGEVFRYFDGCVGMAMSDSFLNCVACAYRKKGWFPLAKEVDSMLSKELSMITEYARTPIKPGVSYVVPKPESIDRAVTKAKQAAGQGRFTNVQEEVVFEMHTVEPSTGIKSTIDFKMQGDQPVFNTGSAKMGTGNTTINYVDNRRVINNTTNNYYGEAPKKPWEKVAQLFGFGGNGGCLGKIVGGAAVICICLLAFKKCGNRQQGIQSVTGQGTVNPISVPDSPVKQTSGGSQKTNTGGAQRTNTNKTQELEPWKQSGDTTDYGAPRVSSGSLH